MNLSEYIAKRNGVPIGHPKSLRNNLQRSLGAKNFSAFWNFWNPIFGYYLGKKIFRPLKNILPVALALVLTFIFCGFVHDLVTTILRGKISLFFSVWFLLMGLAVMVSKHFNYNLSNRKWILRAIVNVLIVGLCALLTVLLNSAFNFY
ncbi:MAG TPA: hypothetical protein VLY84_06230 [Dysgonamonadaceae bacterium]|nr:hypothetical protein [Dysgonamonadaceae bacterium]